MSSNTWTPPAVDSEARRATRRLWRAVEAQHIASTLRLVANVEEQLVLERILDQSKPALPMAYEVAKSFATTTVAALTRGSADGLAPVLVGACSGGASKGSLKNPWPSG